MVPNLAQCEAKTNQKLGDFSVVILPLSRDSVWQINQAIPHQLHH